MRKVKDLKKSELVGLVEAVQGALYPKNRTDHEWDSGTTEEVAAHLEHAGLVPPGMLEVTIAHVTIETEKVRIPGVCPHCGADLRKGSAVILTELVPYVRLGVVERSVDGVEDQLTYDEDDAPESCEGEISWTEVKCNACRKVIVEGRWEEKET